MDAAASASFGMARGNGASERPGRSGDRSWAAVAVGALPILLLTLLPDRGSTATESAICLVCGTRGTADAILNVFLFAPLGLALARRWDRAGSAAGADGSTRSRTALALVGAVLVACLLSLGVEAAQVVLPGRDASLGDVAFNALGGGLGAAIGLTADAWVAPAERTAAGLCLVAGIASAAVLGGTGLALTPAPTRADYWGQWTADLGHLETYAGRVLAASVGGLPVPVGRSARSDTLRSLVRTGAPVRVLAVAGPTPPGLAPIFSIYDRAEREIVLLGADGHDLVFRVRRRADDLRLDRPDSRARDALAGLVPGDTTRLSAFVEGGRLCVGARPGRGACGVGPTVVDGWALLYYPEGLGAAGAAGLGAAWVALLLFPVGLWLRRKSVCVLAVALPLAALLLLSTLTTAEPTPLPGYSGALAGLVAGAAVATRARRRR